MKKFNRISCVLLVLALVLAMSANAFASEINFEGKEKSFTFKPGSSYTSTDLFSNFKNVMPGDKLSESIKIKNSADDCDYINVYLKAVVHDENGNPLTYSETFENTDGKDQANEDAKRDETVATMQDFLSQLTMRIYNGDKLIYNASPDKAGALVDNVLLGTLTKGESLDLKVELDVPKELGNEYAYRVGEVDWVFLAECIQFEKLTVHKIWDDNGYPERPESVDVELLCDGEKVEVVTLNAENQWTYTWDDLDDRNEWTVKEIVPEGYEATYETEDNKVFITNYMDYEPVIPPEPVDLTVKKVWSDNNDKRGVRPDSVTVTLYNGSDPVEKVVLSDKNNWTYSWEDLDGAGKWSVLETGIPSGYVPTYKTVGEVVTVTNTLTLIQTGQLNWPIPVLGGLGILMVLFGFYMTKKRQNENA